MTRCVSLISEWCDSTSRSRHYHQALRGTACKDCVWALVVLAYASTTIGRPLGYRLVQPDAQAVEGEPDRVGWNVNSDPPMDCQGSGRST